MRLIAYPFGQAVAHSVVLNRMKYGKPGLKTLLQILEVKRRNWDGTK
jgi:hypothetical protein